MTEIEDAVKRLAQRPGVKGIIILDSQGVPVRDSFDDHSRVLTIQYAYLVSFLVDKSRLMLRKLDATNELQMLRLRSKKHEIIIAPEKEYTLVVVQGSVPPEVPNGTQQQQAAASTAVTAS